MLKNLAYVAVGGGCGSMMRYALSFVINKYFQTAILGTLAVNIIGCLLVGMVYGAVESNHPLRFLLAVGFCGGFTTFSAFSYENIRLIESGQYATASIYMISSVAAGIFAVWLGLLIVKITV